MVLKGMMNYQNIDVSKKDSSNKLDEEFIKIMLEIEKLYGQFNKHDKIRTEQWTKKLCQVTSNFQWKQNRNLYAIMLLDCILKLHLTDPFNKLPPDGPLPGLNKHIIKNRIGAQGLKLINMEYDFAPIKQSGSESPISQKDMRYSRTISPANRASIVDPQENHTSANMKSILKLSGVETRDKQNIPEKLSGKIVRKELKFKEDDAKLKSYSDRIEQEEENEKTLERQAISTDLVNNGKNVAEIKEILKLKAELELAKLNEESLKNELNIKILENIQFNKKIDNTTKELQQLKDDIISYKSFFKYLKCKIEDEMITFNNQNLANQFIKEMDAVCLIAQISPIRKNIDVVTKSIPPKNHSLAHLQPKNGYNIDNKPELSNTLSNTNNIRNIRSKKYENPITEAMDNYMLKQNNHNDDALIKSPNYNTSTTLINNKSDTIMNCENNNRRTRSNSQNDRETSEFLNYLESFQKENEKLKKETEELLKKSNNNAVSSLKKSIF